MLLVVWSTMPLVSTSHSIWSDTSTSPVVVSVTFTNVVPSDSMSVKVGLILTDEPNHV